MVIIISMHLSSMRCCTERYCAFLRQGRETETPFALFPSADLIDALRGVLARSL